MIQSGRVLALIPARGGSKGLPNKNRLPFLGRPLINWTIEQARLCPEIDSIVVSTDDPTIADIASREGAEVPFIRPAALATDTSSSIDVILHALDFFRARNRFFDFIVLLEPTSPLRETTDVSAVLRMLIEAPDAAAVVCVARVEATHPRYLYELNGRLLIPYTGVQATDLRRQDIADLFYLTGVAYASRVSTLREHRTFYHKQTQAWIVSRHRAIEIDEIEDFIAAEAIMKARLEGYR